MGPHLRNTFVAPAARPLIAASLAASLGAAACAGSPPESSGWVRDGCSVRASGHGLYVDDSSRAAVLRIGLPETVRFRPRNTESGKDGRAVFQHVYETLVAVDCGSSPGPGLAAEWTHDEQGRRWEFEIRPEASFSDGSPVSAAALSAAWRRKRVAGVKIDSVAEDDTGRIIVHLAVPGVQESRAFSHPDLFVRRVPRGAGWPLGTGPYRVAENPDQRSLTLVAADAAAPRLHFEAVTASRARNLLDLGWEVLLTRDRRVKAYAADISRLGAIELPWDRTYVLAVPSASGDGIDPVPGGLLEVLARDAVRAEARPFPGRMALRENSEDVCRAAGPPTVVAFAQAARPQDPPDPRESIRRIGHDQGDPTATDLAARLVALSGSSAADGEDVSAHFLTKALGVANQPELAARLRTLPVPTGPIQRLLSQRSPPKSGHAYVLGLPTAVPACIRIPGYRLFPLIMTRPTLIMDRRLGRVTLGAGGLPIFTNSAMGGS